MRERYARAARRARASSRPRRPTRFVERRRARRCGRRTSGCRRRIGQSRAAAAARRAGASAARRATAVVTAVAADRLRALERAAAARARGLHGQPEARASSSSGGAQRSTRAGSTGARPRRSPSRRCSSRASRSASSGQDTERGTFSHRHLVLHDPHTGETYAPIQHLPRRRRLVRGLQLAALRVRGARLRVRLLGRRAGRARALGGAVRRLRQRRPDRRSTSSSSPGRSKWGQTSRLTLLLPHGYEGNGPGALERPARALPPARGARTTSGSPTARPRRSTSTCSAARRSTPVARPLVVMTPKGLLRLKQAASTLDDLARGRVPARARRPGAPSTTRVQRLVLCSGKVYYDIVGHELRGRRDAASPSRGSSSSTRSPSSAVAALVASLPEPRRRSSGRRRSRRTWAPGARSGTGSRRRRREPAYRAPLRRPAVAGEPERGLPDRAPARAGPHRPRGARRSRRAEPRGARGAARRCRASPRPAARARAPPAARLRRCCGGSRRHRLVEGDRDPDGSGRTLPRSSTAGALGDIARTTISYRADSVRPRADTVGCRVNRRSPWAYNAEPHHVPSPTTEVLCPSRPPSLLRTA